MHADTAIVILAGGEATRLPNKIERRLGGEPMLLRVFNNVRGCWPIYVTGNGNLSPELDAHLECPMLIDRWPRRGPLAALVSAAGLLHHRRIFALAGDAPGVDLTDLQRIEAAWESNADAVVSYCGESSQPLLALYNRTALLREGQVLLANSEYSMRALIHRLRVTKVQFETRPLLNINTAADYALAASSWTKGLS